MRLELSIVRVATLAAAIAITVCVPTHMLTASMHAHMDTHASESAFSHATEMAAIFGATTIGVLSAVIMLMFDGMKLFVPLFITYGAVPVRERQRLKRERLLLWLARHTVSPPVRTY